MHRSIRWITAFMPFVLLLFVSGCSSKKLLTARDYEGSLHQHYNGSPEKALDSFPQKERGTFITTLEKAYLKRLLGEIDLEPLLKLSASIEQRIRFQGSREVESLFYAQTPEGYYASEHEIIWLHLLLSWGFSKKGDHEKGCVEARKASHLLTAPWSHEGHFDDALLRIILGGMWAMCGSWEDAVVDFRKAYQLSPENKWLAELSGMESPPENLFLILGGVGPIPEWDPTIEYNPLRGMRHIHFRPQGEKSRLVLKDPTGESISCFLSPDSSHWYRRHFERDNAIHELLVDSHYTSQAAGTVAFESAKMVAGYAAGTTIVIGSVALGGGIVYFSVMYLSGDAALYGAGGGVLVAAGGSAWGIDLMSRTTRDSIKSIEKTVNPSDRYRFVRYLPEYAWISWSDKTYPQATRFETPDNRPLTGPRKIGNHPAVWIGHAPDIRLGKIDLSLRYPVQTRWNTWRDRFEAYLENPSKQVQWEDFRKAGDEIVIHMKSNRYSFDITVNSQRHRLTISSNRIAGEIPGGLFEDSTHYSIDIRKRSISADRDAMENLIEIPPENFADSLNRQIKSEIIKMRRSNRFK